MVAPWIIQKPVPVPEQEAVKQEVGKEEKATSKTQSKRKTTKKSGV